MKVIGKRLTQLGNASSQQLCGLSKERNRVALADVGLASAAFKTFVRYAAFVEAGRRLGSVEGGAAEIDLSRVAAV
jgi:hypothetical protein